MAIALCNSITRFKNGLVMLLLLALFCSERPDPYITKNINSIKPEAYQFTCKNANFSFLQLGFDASPERNSPFGILYGLKPLVENPAYKEISTSKMEEMTNFWGDLAQISGEVHRIVELREMVEALSGTVPKTNISGYKKLHEYMNKKIKDAQAEIQKILDELNAPLNVLKS